MNASESNPGRPRYLFVTGKLAEPALRQVLTELTPKVAFQPEIAVLPITVAALMTVDWVRRHLTVPDGIERIVLPGLCKGDLEPWRQASGLVIERGPSDLRDLPDHYRPGSKKPVSLDRFDIEILAEINSANALPLERILIQAERYRSNGADLIDLGCDPGCQWTTIGDTVKALVERGFRVSVDSFDPVEVRAAIAAGAELVLSVRSSNREEARRWQDLEPEIEVVAIPDTPTDLASLDETVNLLDRWGIRHRLDPILEPIGFGFAASLGRYIEVRRRYPDKEILMGTGNLTELTDADSAGLNVMLAGFCQEQAIRSILTTEVINWARSSVREFDLARRLVYHAVKERTLPKRLQPDLVLLRDPRLYELGEKTLRELAEKVTDRNYRIFLERGEIHVFNGSIHVHGTDPFVLFESLRQAEPEWDPGHAFYLGYELCKAVTAMTLGKNYTQDQALRWGFLTIPEVSHRNSKG